MKFIIGEAVVSCYASAVSLLAVLILVALSERFRKRSASEREFLMFCVCVIANSVLSFLYNAMYKQTAPWCHAVAVIAKTLRDCVVVMTIALWIVYVYHRLYGSQQGKRSLLGLAFLPLGVILVLLVINLFSGILFTVSADNQIVAKPLLFVTYGVEFVCFCFSAAVVRQYNRKAVKLNFLHISPMILPVALASSVQIFTPYDIGVLGLATGIVLLYFSIIGEYRFVDEESGLYNRGYLVYLFDMAMAGKNDAHSALILEAEGDIPSCVRILHETLHRNGDVIRVGQERFLMFSRESSRTTLQYQTSLVDEAVEKHNTAHPDEKVRVTARCMTRPEGMDTFTFLHSVMDAKEEAGDEMKGIVSMISELDRLDKELKLAADIQIIMLPMVFPPFPDRTEFDLYASMTPAKEVGGDFYDFFLIDRDHLALVIADVSGKGIPAALFMMVSKTLIKNQLMSGLDPAAALERVNIQLCERNSSMMFVTVWLAVLEISTGKGTACNAGHENPGIRRLGGDFELLRYKHCPLVGVNKKAKYLNREFELQPGDCVFVYTDGVPEATNAAQEMFGDGRLTDTLNQNADAAPEEILHRMRGEVDRFVDGAPQFDDITMLCLKYRGPQAGPAAE